MSLLCKWFGHVPAYGYGDIPGYGYFEVSIGPMDGVGRIHANLYTHCERCGTRYRIGMIHVPHIHCEDTITCPVGQRIRDKWSLFRVLFLG
jgi:hypothetical protein